MGLIWSPSCSGCKPPLGTPLQSGHPAARNLLGDWLFNAQGGTVAFDSSGRRLHGTISGPAWGQGGLVFAGSGYVALGSLPETDNIPQLTVMTRVQLTSTAASGWVFKQNSSGYRWGFYHSGDTVYVFMGNGNNAYGYAGGLIATGVWYTAALIFDGFQAANADRLRLWLNGRLIPLTYGGTLPTTTHSQAATAVIGALTTSSSPMSGLMDYASIWTRALTSAEVERIATDPFQRYQRHPIELWAAASGGGGGTTTSSSTTSTTSTTSSTATASTTSSTTSTTSTTSSTTATASTTSSTTSTSSSTTATASTTSSSSTTTTSTTATASTTSSSTSTTSSTTTTTQSTAPGETTTTSTSTSTTTSSTATASTTSSTTSTSTSTTSSTASTSSSTTSTTATASTSSSSTSTSSSTTATASTTSSSTSTTTSSTTSSTATASTSTTSSSTASTTATGTTTSSSTTSSTTTTSTTATASTTSSSTSTTATASTSSSTTSTTSSTTSSTATASTSSSTTSTTTSSSTTATGSTSTTSSSTTSTTTTTTTTSPGSVALLCTSGLYDLTSAIEVFEYENNATDVLLCQGVITFGNGANDLDATGGDFELSLKFDGLPVQPEPQIITFSTDARGCLFSEQFPLPRGVTTTFHVKSPNAADTNVWVKACLYEVGVESIRDELESLSDRIDGLLTGARQQLNVYEGTGRPGSGVYVS